MTEQPGPERSEEPRIDLSKQRPGLSGQSGQSGQSGSPYPPPPPGGGWGAPPPPPPSWQQAGGQPAPPPYQAGGYPPPPGWGPQQWQGQSPGSRLSPSEERAWAGAAHWSAIVAMVVALAFLGPLVVLLVKGNDSPYVRRQAAESLNFQLTILGAALVSGVLITVGIGLLLLPLVGLAWLVFTVVGAVKASSGEDYRYPFALRLVS